MIWGEIIYWYIVITNFSLFSSNATFPQYVMNKVSLNQTPYYNAVPRWNYRLSPAINSDMTQQYGLVDSYGYVYATACIAATEVLQPCEETWNSSTQPLYCSKTTENDRDNHIRTFASVCCLLVPRRHGNVCSRVYLKQHVFFAVHACCHFRIDVIFARDRRGSARMICHCFGREKMACG